MGILSGKKGLIMGLANDKSIAWGVSKICKEHGAELAFTYQGEVLKKRVEPLAVSLDSNCIVECDVSNDESIKNSFEKIEKNFGKLDFILHAIAFANKENLQGKYFDLNRDDFKLAMDISVFSLTAILNFSQNILNNNSSIVTLSYYGSEKIIPNYNVMGVAKAALEASVRYLAMDLGDRGIRVNSISAGPVRTLASSAIGDFKKVLSYNENTSPLKKNVTPEVIGGTAAYLFSDLSSGVTGENIHVDAGFSSVGMSSYCLKDF